MLCFCWLLCFVLSVVLDGEYGVSDVVLSVSCVLDSNGISSIIEVPLNEYEKDSFMKFVDVFKGFL